MSRRAVAAVLVSAGIVAVLVALRGRPSLPPTPEEAVTAFFGAAERGDDAAYLALTIGELRRRLESMRQQAGPETFRANLRRSAAGIKGIRTSRRAAEGDESRAVLDVELVFADRNERQRVVLAPRDGGWAIESLGRAETVKPAIPYGTPVYEE